MSETSGGLDDVTPEQTGADNQQFSNSEALIVLGSHDIDRSTLEERYLTVLRRGQSTWLPIGTGEDVGDELFQYGLYSGRPQPDFVVSYSVATGVSTVNQWIRDRFIPVHDNNGSLEMEVATAVALVASTHNRTISTLG